jgi:N4-(beta-N-acetylglucosaminyl)-L-asparaginase
MDKDGNAGSVCFIKNIKHPISIARKVMEETPHVMLAGAGALKFAIEQGFQEENLLTEASEKAWIEWLKTSEYNPKVNRENHDTIGMLGIDADGDLAGSCTTSGMGYKMQGRVGDSPIIGAGLYVDNEVGGAVATGNGELMMKTLGSFLVVELMKQGANAQEACEEAIDRIVKKYDYQRMQVGYLALDKSGNTGAYAITGGFNYAETLKGETNLIDSKSFI